MNAKDLPKGVNEGHYFEVVDRTHMIQLHLDAAFEGHPAIEAHQDLKESYEKVQRAAGELYQKAGAYMADQK